MIAEQSAKGPVVVMGMMHGLRHLQICKFNESAIINKEEHGRIFFLGFFSTYWTQYWTNITHAESFYFAMKCV